MPETTLTAPGPGTLPPLVSGALPLVGHAAQFLRDQLRLLERGYAEHGDIFRLRLGRRLAVVIRARIGDAQLADDRSALKPPRVGHIGHRLLGHAPCSRIPEREPEPGINILAHRRRWNRVRPRRAEPRLPRTL